MLKAVLDTNIVVSAQLQEEGPSGQILALGLSGLFGIFVSQPLLEEYAEVLSRPKFGFATRETRKWMKAVRGAATVVHPRKTLSVTADPDDNKILECALEGRVDFIVTGKVRHFPKKFQDVRIIKPLAFLTILCSEPR
jgi:uncharacterized protein